MSGDDVTVSQVGPHLAVGAVALAGDRLLLVRRGHGPAAGSWTVPGGHVRFGETLAEAVVREVAEETGLACVVTRFLGWVERVGDPADAGQPEHHFVIMDFLVEVDDPDAEPVAGDDADEALWWPTDDLDGLELVPGLVDFLIDVGVLSGTEMLSFTMEPTEPPPTPERP